MRQASPGYITFPQLGHFGRLGNQLWQVAGIIGMGYSHGLTPQLPLDWRYRQHLSIPPTFYGVVPETAKVLRVANDYLQRYALFAEIADRVREWFRPSPYLQQLILRQYGHLPLSAKSPSHETDGSDMSVHIRLGDYRSLSHLFINLPAAYFKRAIESIGQAKPIRNIYVFSDQIDIAMDMLDGVANLTPVVPKSYCGASDIAELMLMSRCDCHVLSNSTYSLWGAILSDSLKVLYPDRWGVKDFDFEQRWHQMIPGQSTWERFETFV